MGIVKFLIYASALTIFLGVISEDNEAKEEVKKIINEFKPQLEKAVKKIDETLSDNNNMDVSKLDVVIEKKIKLLNKKFNLLKSNNLDKNTLSALKKLKEKIEGYEKKYF